MYPGDNELKKAVAAGDESQIATLLTLRVYKRWANDDIDGSILDLREAAKHYDAADQKVEQFMLLHFAIPVFVSYKRIAEAEYFLAEAETLLDQIDPAAFPPLTRQTLTVTTLDEQGSHVAYKTDPTKAPDEVYREELASYRLMIQRMKRWSI
jgi:hypothetical protein